LSECRIAGIRWSISVMVNGCATVDDGLQELRLVGRAPDERQTIAERYRFSVDLTATGAQSLRRAAP
jgi:hypothetical protein